MGKCDDLRFLIYCKKIPEVNRSGFQSPADACCTISILLRSFTLFSIDVIVTYPKSKQKSNKVLFQNLIDARFTPSSTSSRYSPYQCFPITPIERCSIIAPFSQSDFRVQLPSKQHFETQNTRVISRFIPAPRLTSPLCP